MTESGPHVDGFGTRLREKIEGLSGVPTCDIASLHFPRKLCLLMRESEPLILSVLISALDFPLSSGWSPHTSQRKNFCVYL
jgi:hypothetical protein